jgi:hypothetical protein
MSMAPTLWLVKFNLIYTLNPDLAAFIRRAGPPSPRTSWPAIRTSRDGQVQYADYRSSVPQA